METDIYNLLSEKIENLLFGSQQYTNAASVASTFAKYLFENQIVYFSSETTISQDKPLIVLDRNRKSGGLQSRSIKPSNVVFNVPTLLRAAGSGLLSVAGATVSPILLLTAILLTLADLGSAATIKLTNQVAYVLKAIWELRYSKATFKRILKKTNALLSGDGLPAISAKQLTAFLEDLENYGCVILNDAKYSVTEAVYSIGKK